MKSVIKYLLWLLLPIICLLVWWAGYEYGRTRIPHLRDFQKQIGAKADCKVGPMWRSSETQRLWNNAYLKQTGKIMY